PGFALYAFTCAFLVALFCLALYRASFPTRRSSDLAFKLGRSGRFQLEAAIQSVHAELARTGRTDWTAIALFYERLTRLSPASEQDRKSTRLNSSHGSISYAVFCWKRKKPVKAEIHI